MPEPEDSRRRLYEYLGRIEVEAFQVGDDFARYVCFSYALAFLEKERFNERDEMLVRVILTKRIQDTRPPKLLELPLVHPKRQ